MFDVFLSEVMDQILKKLFLIIVFFAVALSACTDKKTEEEIKGQWHAVELVEDSTGTVHSLPEGITLEFEYPKYSFEGEISESGKYYIKNDELFLLTEKGDPHRKIGILGLSADSLLLNMSDSTGMRTVRFFRQAP